MKTLSPPNSVKSILGLDIGNVLIQPSKRENTLVDTSFLGGSIQDAKLTPPYLGMFEVAPELVAKFSGEVWLVSKAGPRVQEKTRAWLAHHRFFERTGIKPSRLRFCLERADKALHCAELGITHFVDDRLDVLQYLEPMVPTRVLFGPQRPGTNVPNRVQHCQDWAAVARLFGFA
jgi:hypothetical protein